MAVGGGSVIDAAKAMWVFYEHPGLRFDEAKKPFELPALRKKARLAAAASTSGTATEVTPFAVITDGSTHVKYPLADYGLTPDVAIVDPDLAMSMPRELVACTGMGRADARDRGLRQHSSQRVYRPYGARGHREGDGQPAFFL